MSEPKPYQYVVPLTEAAIMDRLVECGVPAPGGPPPSMPVWQRLDLFLRGGLLVVHHTPDSGSWMMINATAVKSQHGAVHVGTLVPTAPPAYFVPVWKA